MYRSTRHPQSSAIILKKHIAKRRLAWSRMCLLNCAPRKDSQEKYMSNHPEPVDNTNEKKFHGYRLLGFILGVVVLLALISAAVDWLALGSLEG